MAGGAKESPRQRMIGMMYLVLTALLALQVSNTVLEKFQFIDETLQQAIKLSFDSNSDLLGGIEEKIKEDPSAFNKGVLDKAKKARELSSEIRGFMGEIRVKLQEAAGGKAENYPNGKDYELTNNIMLGPGESKDGDAYKLETRLNEYIDKMNDLADSIKIEKIAKPASEMSMFMNNPDQKDKDFAFINFDHTPLVAALAVLSQMENDVMKAETQVIEKQAAKIGADKLKFDQITAMASPESRTVAAGTKYKAKMFIVATASNMNPKMTSTAGSVTIDPETKIGEVEFTATPGSYDKSGKVEKTWKGEISIPKPIGGGDTTFILEETYTVVKPVIKIEAANVASLYLGCGNELNVQVPALGVSYNPSFKASGAEVIKGAKTGQITVVPSRATVDLTVSNDGKTIGTEKLKVSLVPKPTVEIQSNGKPVNTKIGGACPRALKAVAIPDEQFRKFLPKDARYRVTKWTVTLARGKKPAAPPQTFNGPTANMGSIAQKARPGDRLVIEVQKVERLNFKGVRSPVTISMQPLTYPIN